MNEYDLTFFAVTVNGEDSIIYVTPEEALADIALRLEDNHDDTYAIDPVKGTWALIRRLGEFECYDEEWMQEVLIIVTEMVKRAKEVQAKKEAKEAKEATTKGAENERG